MLGIHHLSNAAISERVFSPSCHALQSVSVVLTGFNTSLHLSVLPLRHFYVLSTLVRVAFRLPPAILRRRCWPAVLNGGAGAVLPGFGARQQLACLT